MKNVASLIFAGILAVSASVVSAAPEVLDHVDPFVGSLEQPDGGIGGSLDFAFQSDEIGLGTDAHTSEVEVDFVWNREDISYKPWVSLERTSVEDIDTSVVEFGLETTYYGDGRSVVLGASWEKEEEQSSFTLDLTHNSSLVSDWTLGQHLAYEDKGDMGTETTLRVGTVWSIADGFRAVGSTGAILYNSDAMESTTNDFIVVLEHDLGSLATVRAGGRWAQKNYDGMSKDIQAWEVRVDSHSFKQWHVTPYVNLINESVDGMEEKVVYAGLKFEF